MGVLGIALMKLPFVLREDSFVACPWNRVIKWQGWQRDMILENGLWTVMCETSGNSGRGTGDCICTYGSDYIYFLLKRLSDTMVQRV